MIEFNKMEAVKQKYGKLWKLNNNLYGEKCWIFKNFIADLIYYIDYQ